MKNVRTTLALRQEDVALIRRIGDTQLSCLNPDRRLSASLRLLLDEARASGLAEQLCGASSGFRAQNEADKRAAELGRRCDEEAERLARRCEEEAREKAREAAERAASLSARARATKARALELASGALAASYLDRGEEPGEPLERLSEAPAGPLEAVAQDPEAPEALIAQSPVAPVCDAFILDPIEYQGGGVEGQPSGAVEEASNCAPPRARERARTRSLPPVEDHISDPYGVDRVRVTAEEVIELFNRTVSDVAQRWRVRNAAVLREDGYRYLPKQAHVCKMTRRRVEKALPWLPSLELWRAAFERWAEYFPQAINGAGLTSLDRLCQARKGDEEEIPFAALDFSGWGERSYQGARELFTQLHPSSRRRGGPTEGLTGQRAKEGSSPGERGDGGPVRAPCASSSQRELSAEEAEAIKARMRAQFPDLYS